MESVFLHHEPCPKCGSRDNLGVWSDGHKWCFGCGHYEGGSRSLSQNSVKEIHANDSSYSFSLPLPQGPLRWLRKYGITDAEIGFYRIGYDKGRELLLFPLSDDYGEPLQGRYFGGSTTHPKYVTKGLKRGHNFICQGRDSTSRTLIFVEDVVSAIKVGRQYAAYPVLGSHVGPESITRAGKLYPELGIWLDPDMARKSHKFAEAGRLYTSAKVFCVRSDKDPKDYSDKEICEFVELSRTSVV